MKKFMLLHSGFEKPPPEIMPGWQVWFESITDQQVAQGGFAGGRETSRDGTRELPWDKEAVTGYNIIEAANLDAAEKLTRGNPFISSIRSYELR